MSGGDWHEIAARPLAGTLYVLDRLEETERIDRLVAKGERIEMGYLMNAAFASGKNLEAVNKRYEAELRRPVAVRAVGVSRREEERQALAELLRAIADANAKQATGEPVPEGVS